MAGSGDTTPPCGVPATGRRTCPSSIAPGRSIACKSFRTDRSQTRSSTAWINFSWSIDSKQLAMAVSTTHHRPRQDSSIKTWQASCAPRPGRNPKEHGSRPASKTGSSAIFSAACTMRSRTAGIGRASAPPCRADGGRGRAGPGRRGRAGRDAAARRGRGGGAGRWGSDSATAAVGGAGAGGAVPQGRAGPGDLSAEYQRVPAAVAEAGAPVRCKQMCERLGIGSEPRKVEATRARMDAWPIGGGCASRPRGCSPRRAERSRTRPGPHSPVDARFWWCQASPMSRALRVSVRLGSPGVRSGHCRLQSPPFRRPGCLGNQRTAPWA